MQKENEFFFSFPNESYFNKVKMTAVNPPVFSCASSPITIPTTPTVPHWRWQPTGWVWSVTPTWWWWPLMPPCSARKATTNGTPTSSGLTTAAYGAPPTITTSNSSQRESWCCWYLNTFNYNEAITPQKQSLGTVNNSFEFVMPENAVGVLRLKKNKHKRKKTSTAIMPMLSM